MKSTYDSAVERNLSNAERRKKEASAPLSGGHKPYAGNGPAVYIGKRLDVAKTLLGIRKDDDRFNDRITALVKGDK